MVKTRTTAADQSLDFALLQQTMPSHASRNRRALLWLLGLLLLLLASVVTLVLYLNTFEADEEARVRAADAQWLEQSVQFHFRRLEDDLLLMARQSVLGTSRSDNAHVQGGLLWRESGVVLSHGWLAADAAGGANAGPRRWHSDWSAQPANAQALATMQDTTRGLRRAAYAGLMQGPDALPTDVVWLAVPFFERGQFVGNYLAALSLERATVAMVPTWFSQNHAVRLVTDELKGSPDELAESKAYRAALNLPGTDLFLGVTPVGVQQATVPRIFFLVALLFLSGMLVSLWALRRDFVKRQQVQALFAAQVALRTAMENSVTIGLRAWDRKGKILYVNESFCSLVGYSAFELVGKSTPLPYWPPDQADELHLVHRDIIAQGTHEDGVEVQFQHRDGHLLDVLIHEAPLNTADGEQIGWMSSVVDISERKRSERLAARQQERLQASGRLVVVGEVASTLAHELNQPLGALSSFANGLLNRLRSGRITLEEVMPVVERMERLADKAGRIIQRVNAFARRREMSRQRLDLVAFLRGTLSQHLTQRQISLELYLGDGPIWVEADALLLEHAVQNVVVNALHWAPLGASVARVHVRIEPGQGMAAIVVGDSGPGVSEENKEQIFGAFFSASADGMGMGLAICRSVLEAHHGRIDVGRDLQLGGARFTLLLPLASEDAPSPAERHNSA
jgi:two-component system sensor histidine kinase DctS